MKIEREDIVLRDMIESDVEDCVRWYTVEQAWQNWDAPWEKEDADEEAQRAFWREYYEKGKALSDGAFRRRLEIQWKDRHIGWVSSYWIDGNYEWVGKIGDGQTVYRAVGIDICESDIWGSGIGTKALGVYADYCFASGVDELYTQTWSGNVRMIRCAEKLGFHECRRNAASRQVDGKPYDGLTFRLKRCDR